MANDQQRTDRLRTDRLGPDGVEPPAPGYQLHPFEDPFEDSIGPFWVRDDPDTGLEFALSTTARHCNTGGSVHGGVLMTFADFCLCAAACWHDLENERCVTVSLHTDFVRGAQSGELLLGTADLTRRTRTLAFLHGRLTRDGEPIVSFTGICRRFQR